MKCTWCGKGEGKGHVKNKEGDIYYYYCSDCIGDFEKELNIKRRESDDRKNTSTSEM